MPTKLFLSVTAILLGGFAFCTAAVADDAESKTLLKNLYQQAGTPTSPCIYSGGVCSILFPATTDTVTVITSVSCSLILPSGASIVTAELNSQLTTQTYFVLPTFSYPGTDTPGMAYYGINTSTNLIVNKGDKPIVSVYTANGQGNFGCTITGYHS